jgi:hypothetical protein
MKAAIIGLGALALLTCMWLATRPEPCACDQVAVENSWKDDDDTVKEAHKHTDHTHLNPPEALHRDAEKKAKATMSPMESPTEQAGARQPSTLPAVTTTLAAPDLTTVQPKQQKSTVHPELMSLFGTGGALCAKCLCVAERTRCACVSFSFPTPLSLIHTHAHTLSLLFHA